MVRLLVSIVIRLVANGLGLIVAAVVLDDMTLSNAAFFIDVLIFTAVVVIAQPVVLKAALKHSEALMGSSALIAGFKGADPEGDENDDAVLARLAL